MAVAPGAGTGAAGGLAAGAVERRNGKADDGSHFSLWYDGIYYRHHLR